MAARRIDHHAIDHHGDALREVRRICGELPEVTERLSHGSPTFFIRDKQTLCTLLDNHHGAHGVAIWVPAPKGVQEQLVEAEPERFFRPPYVGGRGWVGLRLDIDPDWDEVAAILDDAYRLIAPKKLVNQLPPRDDSCTCADRRANLTAGDKEPPVAFGARGPHRAEVRRHVGRRP